MPNEKPINDPELYSHTVRCINCGHPNELRIPKGTTVADFLQSKICDKCGCAVTPQKTTGAQQKVWNLTPPALHDPKS